MRARVFLLLLFYSALFGNKLPLIFVGNEHINRRELYEAVGLYKPYFYEFYKDEPKVELKTVLLLTQTLQSFYKTKGYFNAEITFKEINNTAIIHITENNPVVVVALEIDSLLDIGSKIGFVNGDIFESDKFTKSKKNIEQFYLSRGYCNIKLDAKSWIDIDLNYAYLSYDVIPNKICHIANITINSSENISSEIIKSLLYFEQNQSFSTNSILKSYTNLYQYSGISKAIIKTNNISDDGVDVIVTISENEKPIQFKAGIGASSDEGLMGLVGVKHNNIFGDLKTLGIETRVTQVKQSITTNLDIPLVNKNATGVEIGFEHEDFREFQERSVYGSVFIKQNVLSNSFVERIVFDSAKTYDSKDITQYAQSSLFVISPKFEYWLDTRDKPLNPSNGYFVNSDIMGSILSEISDASYYKFNFAAGYIYELTASSGLAMKGSFGTLDLFAGEVPSSYKFFAGGLQSNRAYRYRQLYLQSDKGENIEINSITEATLEYRFKIYGDFKGVFFQDTSYLGANSFPDYTSGYYSAGIGFRYITPIGPISVDAGCDLKNPSQQYAFHFHIGESF